MQLNRLQAIRNKNKFLRQTYCKRFFYRAATQGQQSFLKKIFLTNDK